MPIATSAAKRPELELKIQARLVRYLTARGWQVERFIGNALQKGIPDLHAQHIEHGGRWIDVKRPVGGRLTRAQRLKWPVWEACGRHVWILIDASQDEYDLLFAAPNWRQWFTTPKGTR